MPAMADKANDTLIYGIEGDPGNDINTITTAGRYDLMTERMLYSTLYNYYGPDDITYLLAEKLETSPDGNTISRCPSLSQVRLSLIGRRLALAEFLEAKGSTKIKSPRISVIADRR